LNYYYGNIFFSLTMEAAASVESMKPVPCLQDDQFLVALYLLEGSRVFSFLEDWTAF